MVLVLNNREEDVAHERAIIDLQLPYDEDSLQLHRMQLIDSRVLFRINMSHDDHFTMEVFTVAVAMAEMEAIEEAGVSAFS